MFYKITIPMYYSNLITYKDEHEENLEIKWLAIRFA